MSGKNLSQYISVIIVIGEEKTENGISTISSDRRLFPFLICILFRE